MLPVARSMFHFREHMNIQLDLSDAVAELLSYPDALPDSLQHPAWLLAMELEYGSRHVSRGRIRKMVERHVIQEHRALALKPTPDYEPVYVDAKTRFELDVQMVIQRLDYDPYKKKVSIYFPATRQFYRPPRIIAEILRMEGKAWITEAHVHEAIARIRGAAA